MKKSTPFPIEDACVTYSPGARGTDGNEFVVVAARREVVREYESVCEEAGIEAGLVDLATFGVVNLFLSSGPPAANGDWLVVHMRPEYTSIVILRGEDLIFFRNRAEGDEEALQDVVHQTAMYYQDRLGGRGFTRSPARRAREGAGRRRHGAPRSRRAHGHGCRADRSHARRCADRPHSSDAGTDGDAVAAGGDAAAHAAGSGDRLMLRTNLSTRPFYNIRAVQAAARRLRGARHPVDDVQRDQSAAAGRPVSARWAPAPCKRRTDATRLRARCGPRARAGGRQGTRGRVGRRREKPTSIIDMRAFSWTDLLAQFETTLPENVRITAVQPRLERDGRFIIGMRVEARQIGDLEKFLDALEMTGAFHNVLTTDEQATDDGLLEAVIEGSYVQQAAQRGRRKTCGEDGSQRRERAQ